LQVERNGGLKGKTKMASRMMATVYSDGTWVVRLPGGRELQCLIAYPLCDITVSGGAPLVGGLQVRSQLALHGDELYELAKGVAAGDTPAELVVDVWQERTGLCVA
jgi:hypothetical protein